MQRGRIAAPSLVLAALVLAGCTSVPAGAPRPRAREPATSVACACPPGATMERSGCTCRSDLRLVLGACVSARIAAEHCGPSAIAGASECTPRPSCERGRARDRITGDCVAVRDVRSIATGLGMLVAEDEVMECGKERELVAASIDGRAGPPSLGCVARSTPAPARTCPAGSILDLGGACVRVIESAACEKEARVDVARWLRAVIGPDGGEGASPLCSALRRGPEALAPATGQGDPRLAVSLSFPDNDVSLVVAGARTLAVEGAFDAAGTAELERALRPMVEALRSLGGTASQATVATTVHCPRAPLERPTAAAASGERELGRDTP